MGDAKRIANIGYLAATCANLICASYLTTQNRKGKSLAKDHNGEIRYAERSLASPGTSDKRLIRRMILVIMREVGSPIPIPSTEFQDKLSLVIFDALTQFAR